MSGTGRRRKPPTGEDGDEQYPSQPYEQGPNEQAGYESASYGQASYEQSSYEQAPPEQPQYQTYAPAAEPQYDYDWRQPPAAPGTSGPVPGQGAPPPSQPTVPRQPSAPSAPSGPSNASGPAPGYGYQASPSAPTFPPAAAPQQAETPLRARPRPRPEPQDDFEFDFDLDGPDAGAAGSASGVFGASGVSATSATSAASAASAMGAPNTSAASSTPGASSLGAASSGGASTAGASAAGAPPPGGSRTGDKDGYRPDDFDFVEKADDPDVGGWLSFSESRADSRAERSRRMRTRLVAVGVLVALVAAGVGIYAWLGGSVPGVAGAAQATKSMILFRLDDAKGDSVGDALMVTNRGGSTSGSASGTGAIVVIPAQMQIDDQGFGAQPFGGDMASDQPPAGSDEVSTALGVTPDGVWTMDETTFGIFVTELGGVSVTTNTAVPATTADPKGVTAGATSLDGAQALAYATYQASGEAASVQAARFGQVLEALMAKMPTFANAVTAYLNQLALIPDPSLPLTKLSPILAALAAQQVGGRVTVVTLPLSADGSNTLNATGAAQIVGKLLGGTVKAGASAGQSARVLVQNATGTSGSAADKLAAAAQAKLVDSGYTYNAGSTVGAQAHTVVEVASSSGQSLAQQVAAALGLSGSAVQVVSGLSSVDDVTVVLGQDWTSLSTQ